MTVHKGLRIQNRVAIVLLLPIVILFWMVGWILYWRGDQNISQRRETYADNDGIQTAVAMFEESKECNN